MNYTKLYDDMAQRAKAGTLRDKTYDPNHHPTHHLDPVSINPARKKDPDNIIDVSYRGHYVFHQVYAKKCIQQLGDNDPITKKAKMGYAASFSMGCKYRNPEAYIPQRNEKVKTDFKSEGRKGAKFSEQQKQHLSESHMGQTAWNKGKSLTQQHKQHLSESRKGKHLSEQTKQKLSDAMSGENHPMYGKHHSKQSKQKMSESHIGKTPGNKGKKASEIARQHLSESHKGKHYYKDPSTGKRVYY